MNISLNAVKELLPNNPNPEDWQEAFNTHFANFGIRNLDRVAAFISVYSEKTDEFQNLISLTPTKITAFGKTISMKSAEAKAYFATPVGNLHYMLSDWDKNNYNDYADVGDLPSLRDALIPDVDMNELKRKYFQAINIGLGREKNAGAAATAVPAPRSLRPGSRGGKVRQVQSVLGIESNGVYDDVMEEAVKRYQKRKGLADTGVVDPTTSKKMGINL